MTQFNKNKKIIAYVDALFIVFILVAILSQMEIRFKINFHYLENVSTRLRMSIAESIFAYLIWGIFIGMIVSASIYLISCYVVTFLHRKDKDDPPPRFIPIPRKYDDEIMFAFRFSFSLGYIITFLGLALYALGILNF